MGIRVDKRRVKELMLHKNIETQKQLAERSSLAQGTLVTMLQGGGFSTESLEKLARGLDCNPIDLLVAEGFPAPQQIAPAPPIPA